MMRSHVMVAALLTALLFAGCDRVNSGRPAMAGLTPVDQSEVTQLGIMDRIKEEGSGNVVRELREADKPDTPIVELAAGREGKIEYALELKADVTAAFHISIEFLSTQGTGQLVVTALDQAGREIGSVGYVYTGTLAAGSSQEKWLDYRRCDNYEGRPEVMTVEPELLLKTHIPGYNPAVAAIYRLRVIVGQGQHTYVRDMSGYEDKTKAFRLSGPQQRYDVSLGDTVVLEADLTNISRKPQENIEAAFKEPEGYGLLAEGENSQTIRQLAPGKTQKLIWRIKAQRPDAVNFNRPWPVVLTVNDVAYQVSSIAVTDKEPGKIYYVMTEDLEPIDSAGYPVAWGNANGWLDPEEFSVQLLQKSERLNAIAETYGAKWTHYTAWPAMKGAEWAATRSVSGEWPRVIDRIRRSVQEQSKHGHEYAVHLHLDYDPALPGNHLSYEPAVNGFWGNHLHHGWAHSESTEGDFSDYASRTGTLYAYQRIMDELSAGSGQGQLLSERAGSFDFGNGSQDEQMSIRACRKVGLWGSGDADGNMGGPIAGDYGKEIYFTKTDDINTPAEEFSQIGMVEFKPTPRQWIAYDRDPAAAMNEKADQGVRYFMDGGSVKPGVHAITGFTHAMFIMGQSGWKSLEGGQFKALEDHLAYLRRQYADRGIITFATASELVRAYIDYYTPDLEAVYGERLSDSFGVAEYAVRLLGKGIPRDAGHIHTVRMKYPLYLRDSAYRISILKNGRSVYSTWGLPTPFNDIEFTVDKDAVYTMKVYHSGAVYQLLSWLQGR
ncbi:hypothetical protein P22_2580 [Propionispora sp. 2/2-37]|uniref:hypothetical protein n=1 Tax=Propionispora sp. 2/2-37 TaxID=1677858 RepID=UPI0006BB6EEC|nr:hypothetical protein [Propionispora sp. 2/2-37]CUH96490.1 hypothetical protein P22_2580 [Propionispora sp. 2/2-37]